MKQTANFLDKLQQQKSIAYKDLNWVKRQMGETEAVFSLIRTEWWQLTCHTVHASCPF